MALDLLNSSNLEQLAFKGLMLDYVRVINLRIMIIIFEPILTTQQTR